MTSEILIAGASLFVAISAFWLSWHADARGEIVVRTQLFLALRTRFLNVLEDLPSQYADPDWQASDSEESASAIRYWHHAFDEWYITTRLNDKIARQLWEQFYSKAVLAGLKHNGLRKVLIEKAKGGVGTTELWTDFLVELNRIWKDHHPGGPEECEGIECEH